MKNRLNKFVAYTALASALGGQFASAQEADVEDATVRLNSVTVTVERYETNLQDTPVAVTSIDSVQLEKLGINTFQGLREFAPNITIEGDPVSGALQPEISIRGIGAGVSSSSAFAERPVGVYIDGLFLARSQGSVLSVIDAEKVEILRGPQGTLFGRNTTGGAITFTSKKPVDEFEAEAELSAGNFGLREGQVSVNVPISESVAIRALYANNEEDGYVRRGNELIGSREEEVARLQLRADLSENLVMNLSATKANSFTNGDPRVNKTIELGTDGGLGLGLPVPVPAPNGGFPAGYFGALQTLLVNAGEAPFVENDPRLAPGPFELPAFCMLNNTNPYDRSGGDCDHPNSVDLTVLTGELTWQVGENLTVTSVTGMTDMENNASADFLSSGGYKRPWNVYSETFQQEFKATYLTETVNLVGGVIYFTEEASEDEITFEVTRGFPGGVGLTDAEILAGVTTVRRDAEYFSDSQSLGAFVQGTYSFTDRFDVTAGVRYSSDEKDAVITYAGQPRDPRGAGRASGSESWDNVDWRLAASFDVTDDIMIYASVTDAYKSGVAIDSSLEDLLDAAGGADVPNGTVAFVDPEEALGYEAGIRSEFFDNRLRVNLTAFQTDYTNRQSPVFDAVQNQFEVANIGDVEFKGLEGELAAAVTDSFTLTASFGLIDYELENGNTLAGVREESFTLGADYLHTFDNGGEMNASLNYGWNGDAWGTSNDFPAVEGAGARFGGPQRLTPSYGVLNGRLSYEPEHANWSVAVFGQNLTDELYFTGNLGQGFPFGFLDTSQIGTPGRPRSYGVSIKIRH